MHTQEDVGGDARGTDVQGVALTLRDPVLVHTDQFLNGFQMSLGVHRLGMSRERRAYRQAQTLNGGVHTKDILHRAEHADVTFLVTVGLHSLKALSSHHHNANQTSVA